MCASFFLSFFLLCFSWKPPKKHVILAPWAFGKKCCNDMQLQATEHWTKTSSYASSFWEKLSTFFPDCREKPSFFQISKFLREISWWLRKIVEKTFPVPDGVTVDFCCLTVGKIFRDVFLYFSPVVWLSGKVIFVVVIVVSDQFW